MVRNMTKSLLARVLWSTLAVRLVSDPRRANRWGVGGATIAFSRVSEEETAVQPGIDIAQSSRGVSNDYGM